MILIDKYKILFFILSISCLAPQCIEKNKAVRKSQADNELSLEIPMYGGSYVSSYTATQTKARDLGLDSLISGYDSLQIRIWYEYALADSFQLLIIQNHSSSWKAELQNIAFSYDQKNDKFSFVKGKTRLLRPKSGWSYFVNNIFESGLLELPDMDKVDGYKDEPGSDGLTYNFEVATRNKYRFFSYWMPEIFTQYQETKKVSEMLRFIEAELNYKRIWDYDKSSISNR